MDIRFEIHGKGEAPQQDMHVQKWHFRRSFTGYLEVEVKPERVGVPPNDRSVLVIRPKSGGVCTVVGEVDTFCSLYYIDGGEGSSSMIYHAYESYGKTQSMEAKDLIMEMILDETTGVWGGQFSIAGWENKLASNQKYYGSASYVQGPQGGWLDDWHHSTTDPNHRTADGQTIVGGWYPESPTIVDFPTDATLRSSAGYYVGSRDYPIPPAANPGESWNMTASFSWTLRDKLPDAELVVRSSRYTDWLPYLQTDNSPGEPLRFVATVESPTGDSLERIRVKKFLWTLDKTSREPGLALNYPLEAKDTDPDLRLVGWTTDPEGQKSEHNPVDGDLTSSIEVLPYDWGGWSTLQVKAELDDGRTLEGQLKPASSLGGSDTDILIPWRRPDSKVAEFWKQLLGLTEMNDQDDVDAKPAGRQGADGDGFTVYEEYRGFYVNGTHEFLDPQLKDVFVLNQVGGRADNALRKFRQLSGLTVYEEKQAGLIYSLNRNRREGPTLGNQAGIWLRSTSLPIRPNEGLRPGTRLRDQVALRVTDKPYAFGNSKRAARMLDSMLLQGLFQAVGVDRPGPSDKVGQFELQLPPTGSTNEPRMIQLPNTPVVIIDFFGDDIAKKWAPSVRDNVRRASSAVPVETPGSQTEIGPYRTSLERQFTSFDLLVGEKGGAHSGQEECVMRDWFADIYRTRFTDPQGRPIYRLIDPQRGAEQPGTVLGTTRRGTGVNAPDRVPEPRYGDSGVGVPANRQMILPDHLP